MKKGKPSISKTEFLTRVGILTAIATVMYLFLPEIPILTDHLKFDVSDLPAMVAGLTTGPGAGIAVIIIKNIFHLFKSTTFGVGEIVNILVGSTMILMLTGCCHVMSKLRKAENPWDLPSYLIASAATTVVTVGAGFVFNLALTPVFLQFMGSKITMPVVWGFAVFSLVLNLVKALANTLLAYPIFLALRRFVKNRSGKTIKI